MEWKIELTPEAQKNLKKLEASEAQRILNFFCSRLRFIKNPRDIGKPLIGPTLSGLWLYRVGDYRILCRIEDEKITVLVVQIGHRSKIYDGR